MEIDLAVFAKTRATLRSAAQRSVKTVAVTLLTAALAACGGGGGNGNGGNPPPDPTGQVAATVVDDRFGTPIEGATVRATSGSTTRTGTTNASGTTTVGTVPTGSVSVTAVADGFIDSAAQTVTVNENAATSVTFRLLRVSSASGGVLEAGPAAPLGDGSSYTFRIRVVVVDQDAQPVEGLSAAAFTLEDCTPAVETPSRPNCVRSIGATFDAAYTVNPTTAASFAPVPPEPGSPFPYAAALLLDSSGSIRVSDPTDARIFASKVFLEGIGAGDLGMLAAFADDFDNPSLLPESPVTVYPCSAAPCAPPAFTNDGTSLFDSVDSLAGAESGGTPLYESLSFMIDTVANTAPATPTNLRRAVVLFSDGEDIYCAENGGFENCTQQRQLVISQSQSSNVDIFTVGLTNQVNSLAMAELAIGGGGAYLFAENTEQLIPIYGSLGRLLSGSLPTYEMVWTVTAATGTLIQGRAVLGRLNVDTGEATFTLPFVVQIFPPP